MNRITAHIYLNQYHGLNLTPLIGEKAAQELIYRRRISQYEILEDYKIVDWEIDLYQKMLSLALECEFFDAKTQEVNIRAIELAVNLLDVKPLFEAYVTYLEKLATASGITEDGSRFLIVQLEKNDVEHMTYGEWLAAEVSEEEENRALSALEENLRRYEERYKWLLEERERGELARI